MEEGRTGKRGGRQGERERKKETVFCPLAHFPKGYHGQSWAGLKPGDQRAFRVFPKGAGAQALGPASAVLPGTVAGSWIESEATGA